MGNLKFLVVVSAILAASTVEAALDESEHGSKIQAVKEKIRSKCIDQAHIDETSISKVLQGEFNDKPNLKVYTRCVLTESGAINERGDFNVDVMGQLLPDKIKEEVLTVLRRCITELTDITILEEKAYNFFKCYYNRSPDNFIFF